MYYLQSLCHALGWQGGTIHQVLTEVERLNRVEKLLYEAEEALGENLQFIADLADLPIRQKDQETLRRLSQLNTVWTKLVKELKGYC